MAEPAFEKSLQLPLSSEKLATINDYLRTLDPQLILSWAIEHLPGLYQTTAFGLTGLVAIDMLSKLAPPESRPTLIFIDTLYHFPETYELVGVVEKRYGVKVRVFKPDDCETVEDFEKKWGEKLWEQYEDIYDYAVKVEPGRRAYKELKVQSVITGRRASQGGERALLQPLEVDSTGLLKLNPLFAWTFSQVDQYIKENNVPRNKLLDRGYRSVGDWHSTCKSGEGDVGERAGRWAGKQGKTECGLHKDYSEMQRKVKELETMKVEPQDAQHRGQNEGKLAQSST
ncbi:Phosphoadenosine phosphosulfate reductase family-domain-containing protein [Scleroderma citrinum]